MRLGLIVRLLMLTACLVPFTSARQVAAVALPVPAPIVPAVPQEEEDTEREEQTAAKVRARASTPPSHRPRAALGTNRDSDPGRTLLTVVASSPAKADPFRNGLGCPFRC